MNFLVWYNPFTWVTDLIANAWGIIWSGLDILLYKIATWIYNILIALYDLFDALTKVRLLDSEVISSLAERVGIILGIVMLFLIIFSSIKLMLDPDKISDKEQGIGNIVKKVLIVIVMLGLSTSVFNALYGMQKIIIESNIMGKILLPNEVDTENFGPVLASELFTSFYRINDVFLDEDGELNSDVPDDVEECYETRDALKSSIISRNGYSVGTKCLNKTVDYSDSETDEEIDIIEFNPIIIIGCGLFAAYFIFSYCVSVGVRVIQLAFLEIISPMAIISYLSPKKDTMFEKWSKLYFSTYINLFVRILIISFTVFLIATIFESDTLNELSNSLKGTSLLASILLKLTMVLALLTFAKKAPDLLKNLSLSDGSGIGLGLDDNAKTAVRVGGALGATGTVLALGGAGKAIQSLRENGIKGSLNNLKENTKSRIEGFTKGFTDANGAKGKVRYLGSMVKTGARKVYGGFSNTYKVAKKGAKSGSLIAAMSEAGTYAKYDQGNKKFNALQFLDDIIGNDPNVKKAKMHRDEMAAQHGINSVEYKEANKQFSQAKEEAWNNQNDEHGNVQAAKDALYRETGLKFDSREDFDKALETEREKNTRNWKYKEK